MKVILDPIKNHVRFKICAVNSRPFCIQFKAKLSSRFEKPLVYILLFGALATKPQAAFATRAQRVKKTAKVPHLIPGTTFRKCE